MKHCQKCGSDYEGVEQCPCAKWDACEYRPLFEALLECKAFLKEDERFHSEIAAPFRMHSARIRLMLRTVDEALKTMTKQRASNPPYDPEGVNAEIREQLRKQSSGN